MMQFYPPSLFMKGIFMSNNNNNHNRHNNNQNQNKPNQTPASNVTATESKPSASLADEIDSFNGKTVPVQHFQSEAAQAATLESFESAQDTGGPIRAEVGAVKEAVVSVNPSDIAQMNRNVKIRPREDVPRFRYGGVWYQLQANKEMIVPKHMAVVLEQKGML